MSPVSNSAAGGGAPAAKSPPSMSMSMISSRATKPPPRCYFFRAGSSPKAPAPVPPVCIPFADAFQRLLTAHGKPSLCVVCLPVISTFQRHSTQHLLHYRSPFSFHFCFRSVPSGFVQRIGCGACGLGHPHQVWWAPPMYIARAWPR
jgi:hypothetical protein